jgi:tripartite-type tricarboxylate transporter receptor subunit TctC
MRKVVLLAWALCWPAAGVAAEAYPTRNVRLVAPFAPGGTNDTVARTVAQHLSERLGKTFIVENRTGAGGILANDIVAKSTPDGHTLLVTNPAFAISAGLFKSLPYDPVRSFTPITEIMRAPNVLVINPALNANTLSEFIALARANPGKFNYGSGGYGSALHLYSELFKSAAKVDITHVPYKGGSDNMTALLGGQVHMNIIQYQANVLALIKSGRLRALAVTTAGKRSASLPDVPSMSEAGLPGMTIYVWSGLVGPEKMPRALVDKLQSEVAKTLATPSVSDRFAGQDAEMIASKPQQFVELIRSEIRLWGDVIKTAGITPQ